MQWIFPPEELEQANTRLLKNKAIFTPRKPPRKKSKNKDAELPWFNNSNDYAQLSEFISFHQQTTGGSPHPLQATLNYLLLYPETATHRINAFHSLLKMWLEVNPLDAITWYANDETQVKLNFGIRPNDNPAGQLILLGTMLQSLRVWSSAIEIIVPIFAQTVDLLENLSSPKDSDVIDTLYAIACNPRYMELPDGHAAFLIERLNQSVQTAVTAPGGLTPDAFMELNNL